MDKIKNILARSHSLKDKLARYRREVVVKTGKDPQILREICAEAIALDSMISKCHDEPRGVVSNAHQ